MPNAKFDSKSFNPEAFKYMVSRIPNLKTNELKKSNALVGNPEIRNTFTSQNGTSYARIAMRGLLDGAPVNYDGQTDITSTSTKTYEQGIVVIGRAKAWTEKDFSYDITGGVDFMQNVAQQVRDYWDAVDQDTLLAVLTGIFSMTGTQNLKFVDGHTYNVGAAMSATSLNTATQKACGANKKAFTMAITHSMVATNLENLKLLTFLTHTDKEGLTREIGLATWNGKIVLIDDNMPVTEVAASSGVTAHTEYTTYVLGAGSIFYENIGAKVPYEMARDPKSNGGMDTLYTRQRKVFAPMGISYEKASQASLSPTDAELKNGANWSLVHSGETTASSRTYIDHKAIPIARIISWG